MTVYKFHQYKFPVKKQYRCDRCRKMVRRARTFTGTCNPFTTPPFMTYAQMRVAVQPDIDRWLSQVTGLCTPCDRLVEMEGQEG